jgi:predicted P-loop ATPase/phage/plasmid primase-like uncharacterized protein
MTDFVEDFIDAMVATGCEPAKPSDIVAGAKNKLIKASNDGRAGKSLYYTFEIEGDKASGRWHCCKNGASGNWFSKSDRKWSDEDKQAWADKIKKQQEDHEQEILKAQQYAEEQAKKIWAKAKIRNEHKYLEKKRIKGTGSKQLDDMLIIPMRDKSAQIKNLQTILPDGSKYNSFKDEKGKWVKGGKKQELYHSLIKKGCPLDNIIITEGYATADTIHEVTGLPVVCAFDAGNLKPVAKIIRDKYPKSKIIIAADNDQWTLKEPRPKKLTSVKTRDLAGDDDCWGEWRAEDLLFNVGVEKAKQAALAVNGFIVYPDFPLDQPEKLTDFNDLKVSDGADAVKDKIMNVVKATDAEEINNRLTENSVINDTPPNFSVPLEELEKSYMEGPSVAGLNLNPAYEVEISNENSKAIQDGNTDWWFDLVWKKNPDSEGRGGVLERNSGLNMKMFIDRLYHGLFRLNEFSDKVWICRPPVWESKHNFRPRVINDNDITNMAYELETRGLVYNKDRVKNAIEVIAEQDKFHPLRDYFDKLEWDGVPRLNTWLKKYLGAYEQPDEYLSVIGTMWMVAGARRVYEAGTKFDHMLVLEGKTSIGKSSALKILATFGDSHEYSYFTDALPINKIEKPEALTILQGKLIVEFGELSGMDKMTDEALKNWITITVDEIVKKYKSYSTVYPRQFILAGTTNANQWLRDATGNRRYWPVACTRADFKGLIRDRDQLWAEAIHLHREGMRIDLAPNDPIYLMAEVEQSHRLATDSWEEQVLHVIEGKKFVTSASILRSLGFNIQQTSTHDQKRINDILRNADWVYKQQTLDSGKRVRGWVNPKYAKKPIVKKELKEAEIEL